MNSGMIQETSKCLQIMSIDRISPPSASFQPPSDRLTYQPPFLTFKNRVLFLSDSPKIRGQPWTLDFVFADHLS